MRILTLLVVIMGIMIVVGLFVVVFTIASRVIDKASKDTITPWTIKENIPKNAEIDDLAADGGKLFIKLDSKNGTSHILVFDSATGKQIGKLEFEPQ
ncbi:DUF6476 family protein [Rhodospirillaceae bacterium]|nr:DUF6476 family protein [Rhodospirillaceae bacterium]